MVTSSHRFAIALEQVDNSVVNGTDIYEELDRVSDTIAPDPLFDFVHPAHEEFAQEAAREFNRIRLEQILYELAQGRRVLEAEERLTRPKEFRLWKQCLSATAADIRKWVKLVLTFGDFEIEKLTSTPPYKDGDS